MNRELAKELKAAGFPAKAYQLRHKFYPNENATRWADATRIRGVTIPLTNLKITCRTSRTAITVPLFPI